MSKSPFIVYTWTDEAPALATHAFLPVIRAFAGAAGNSAARTVDAGSRLAAATRIQYDCGGGVELIG